MSVNVALVRIKDGKRKLKYIVLKKDIQGFNPKNAEDIPDREYLVKWQDSFHNELDEVEHDGYWPGEILLAGGK